MRRWRASRMRRQGSCRPFNLLLIDLGAEAVYEAHFALRTRPFLPHPGPGSFVRFESLAGRRRQAEECLRQGAGFVLVTGEPGIGKSAWCADLARSLESQFKPVTVSVAGGMTPLDLQACILELLGHSAAIDSPAAARTQVLQAARDLQPGHDGLLLVVDDAHEAGADLLQELRVLTAPRQQEPPLVRLILCGSVELEEQLADPALEGVSRAVGCHVVLEELTRQESREYIQTRIAHAGGTLEEVFSDDAVEAICEAAAGRPRCLNQLCDHSLLLAYVNEQRPAPAETIFEALDDLKGLALPWNLPYRSPRAADDQDDRELDWDTRRETLEHESPASASEANDPISLDPAGDNWWDDRDQIAVIEVGGGELMGESAGAHADWEPATVDAGEATPHSIAADVAAEVIEVHVQDRYADLDRAAESAGGVRRAERWPAPVLRLPAVELAAAAAQDDGGGANIEELIAAHVHELQVEIRAAVDGEALERARELSIDPPEWDVVLPEPEGWNSRQEEASYELRRERPQPEPATASDTPMALRVTPACGTTDTNASAAGERPRRYAQLFSRLRWRRAAAEQAQPTPGVF